MNFYVVFEVIFVLIPYVPYVWTLSPLSLTKQVSDGFGICIHFTHPMAGEMEMLAEAGFKLTRNDLKWDATERKKGEYDFKNYEFLMSELEKHNMSAYFILDYGNTLYEKQWNGVVTEEGRKAYAKWAATVVDHFKGRGIIWEIWNEPNIKSFWVNDINVHQYIDMALEAVKAIRAKTPNEIIIGPAVSQVPLDFLEECFKAGLLNYWDAVSIHPYRRSGPENVIISYTPLKILIERYTPKDKTIPIISGEWGYSSVWGNFNATIQGKYMPRQLLTNVMNNIPVSMWYDWHDDGTDPKDSEAHFGIVEHEYHAGKNPVYTPKDAFISVKTLSSVLKGYHYVKRIATNNVDDFVLMFSDSKTVRLAVWTISGKEHQIEIPSDKCDFEIINYKGDKRESTSAKDGSLTITINDSPNYIIAKGPNHALESSTTNLFKAIVMPINAKTIPVRINSLYGDAVNGTVKLTHVKGIETKVIETNFQIKNEMVIEFQLKSKADNDFTIGLQIESQGNVQTFEAHKFHFLDYGFIADCSIAPYGDSKVKSDQSLSVHPAPEPLFDSDYTVLKIDYHFYGKGWKFLNVYPNKYENRKVSDQPKAFGVWIFGDNQKVTLGMRIVDSAHQTFQLHPESNPQIDWEGWRYVMFNITEANNHWGGANDGIVHYPIEWDAFLLLDNQKQSEIKSAIYIMAPIIIY